MSLRLTLLNAGLRVLARPRLARLADPAEARREMARIARYYLARPRGVAIERRKADGTVPSRLHVTAPGVGRKVLLYFHGGGYVAGSPDTHLGLLAALARATGMVVIAPRYRLAPEHPFPAAQDDAFVAWQDLVAQGCEPGDIVLAGDSAGGGLALSLLARLCADGVPPAAVVTFSAWTDMTGSGPSCSENAERDPLLPAARLDELAGFALGGQDRRDPAASPLFAAYPGCPPVFFAVSQAEILRDDSLRLARRLEGEGAVVEVELHADCPHAWPIFTRRIPEADATIGRAADFVRRVMAPVAAQRPA